MLLRGYGPSSDSRREVELFPDVLHVDLGALGDLVVCSECGKRLRGVGGIGGRRLRRSGVPSHGGSRSGGSGGRPDEFSRGRC